MSGRQIYLICSEEDRTEAESLLASVLERWPVDSVPVTSVILFDDLHDADPPRQGTVAWVYTNKHTLKTDVYLCLDVIERWMLPAVLTRPEEILPVGSTFRDGVIIGPVGCNAEQFHMMLSGLMSQVGLLRQLSTELNITQRQNANMQSEFARIEEELRMAANLQREFLPTTLPRLHDVGFRVLFRPASYVSGDIYDISPLDDDHIAFYLADAVGHGVPAALMTVFIRHALLSAQARWKGEGHLPPDRALTELNKQMLKRQKQSVQFATACYALLNCKTGQLDYASAGHPPAFWLKTDGEVEQIHAEGPLLGVFEDGDFEVATIQLDPGDRFLMYTDGFEMAFGDDRNVANTEYIKELYQLGNGDMADAMNTLIEHIDEHAGSLHQRDDLTALLAGVGLHETADIEVDQHVTPAT